MNDERSSSPPRTSDAIEIARGGHGDGARGVEIRQFLAFLVLDEAGAVANVKIKNWPAASCSPT
jgi:hypothetical protein